MNKKQIVHDLLNKYLPLFPEDEDLPELEAALQALILKAQIAELKQLTEWEVHGEVIYARHERSYNDRLAALQQQLKEVEESKQ